MIAAIDSNILYDVLSFGSAFVASARARIHDLRGRGSLIVCEVVYAELAARIGGRAYADRFLKDAGIRLERSEIEALGVAGTAWRSYTARRSEGLVCHNCGRRQQPVCDRCGESLRARQHLVADFIIGAHALLQADGLLTRDRRYYQTYFPDLTLL